ncbi:MAG TPA: hypothetical protein VIX38_01715 [Nitrososphaeraceae archaeon]
MSNIDIRPFDVDVPEAELDELLRRIKATRWPVEFYHWYVIRSILYQCLYVGVELDDANASKFTC